MFTYTVNEQIKLALLQPHNADEIYKVVDSNRAYLKEWLGWVDNVKSAEDYRATIIPSWLKQFAENNGFNAGIYYDERLVGMISLHFINWKTKHTSIGYYLAKEAQNQGIITNCVRELMNFSFDILDLNKVEIQCAKENHKSRKIPERLGLKLEGISRDAEFINGHYNDIATYSILKNEWSSK
ncbi:GNAT family N-acetyltransferase [Peribacillus sp. NPDC056705]|uniref:GNAT family N-acetyltransferase n=1 Tax=Peribacillus sp. NPDC056705 TaxID=3345918 RepID=UPI00374870AF